MAKAAGGDKDYAGLKISEADLPNLVAFQQTLAGVDDETFRDLILSAKVVDVTAPPETEGKQGNEANSRTAHGHVAVSKVGIPLRKQLHTDESSRKLWREACLRRGHPCQCQLAWPTPSFM